MSVRTSAISPRNASGDMYTNVPATLSLLSSVATERVASSTAFGSRIASPKSRTLA